MENNRNRIGSLALAALLLMAFTPSSYWNDPWPVPEKFQKMPNPVKAYAESLENGKKLFVQFCQSCHGRKGNGDGPKALQLDIECGDFSRADFQKQTDGSIFYKISEGRKVMPSFKKTISTENEIWALVNYTRTFK
jgi:mono/diheme cytochrome c family protein